MLDFGSGGGLPGLITVPYHFPIILVADLDFQVQVELCFPKDFFFSW